MHEVLVRDLAEFIKHTEGFDLLYDLTVFRGQAVEGNLLPGVARADPSVNNTSKEKMVLEQLRLLGASLLPTIELSSLDLLVHAQHFSLKTRLLDWTSNPLAALWFACNDRLKGDVFVYALGADKLLAENVYSQDPFAIKKTRVFQPRLNNPRVIAQHGWFTLHRYSVKSKRFVPLEKNTDAKAHITKFRVPDKARIGILRSLDRHGISGRTLFPDLPGLCAYLNWKHDV